MQAQAYAPRWTAWGGAYGGSNKTSGDPAVLGSHDLAARTAGFAGGLDNRLSPNSVVGLALAGGGTNWSLANGLGGLAKFDGEFASHSSTYAGTGTVRYTW